MAVIAPGPRGHPILGVLPELRKEPLAFFLRCASRYGDVVRMRAGPRTVHLLSHPEHIRHVLQENNRAYDRQTPGYEKLRLALGNGLVTSEGEHWRRQRRIAQPAFHRERIMRFATTMSRATLAMLDRWAARARPDLPFDIAAEMMRLTLEIVATTIFSVDLGEVTDRVGTSVGVVLRYVTDRATSLFGFVEDLPVPATLRFRRALAELDGFVLEAIRDRRTRADDPGDLLGLLLHARDEETGQGMTDIQLRDELVTMFGAGHETTANALTWTFRLLSEHPAVERKLHGELEAVLAGRPPELADLERLPYLRQVIRESMRLYPPVWTLGRNAKEADVIGGFEIPRSSLVLMAPYVVHRHPRYWDNPEGFDPERWTTPRVAELPRFAYFPFGGGPHLCIGNNFALLEAEIILANVLSRYRLDLSPGEAIELEPTITLRPRSGVPVVARPRPPRKALAEPPAASPLDARLRA